MRAWRWEQWSLVGLLCTAALAQAPGVVSLRPPSAGTASRVVIVSWDGAKAEVLRDLLSHGRLPTIRRLCGLGRWTWSAQTILPSLTLPSHTSMLTGVPPEVHGITWNSDAPEKGPLKVPTVFSLSKDAGCKTAMIVGKLKLRLLAPPGTVDTQILEEGTPGDVARRTVEVLNSFDPDLLFVHFRAPDDAGHEWGWGDSTGGQAPSPEYTAALEACDAAMGRLLAALESQPRWRGTLLILTADHGGRRKGHGGSDPQEVRIPWFATGGLVASRGELKVPVSTMDTAATALAALGVSIPAKWTGRTVPGVLSPRAAALKPAA